MMFTAATQMGFECQNLVFMYGQFSLKPSKLEITHSAQGVIERVLCMQFYFKFLFDLLRSNINNCEINVIVDSFLWRFTTLNHWNKLIIVRKIHQNRQSKRT